VELLESYVVEDIQKRLDRLMDRQALTARPHAAHRASGRQSPVSSASGAGRRVRLAALARRRRQAGAESVEATVNRLLEALADLRAWLTVAEPEQRTELVPEFLAEIRIETQNAAGVPDVERPAASATGVGHSGGAEGAVFDGVRVETLALPIAR
jgi:hypothetical protein